MEADPLALFPAPRGVSPRSDRLAVPGLALRPAASADLPFLRRLHAETRAPELLAAPWSPAEKAAFCDSQFALQHADYLRRFPRGDFWMVTREGRAIGRLYLDRGRREWRVIDITIAGTARGQGLGTALLAWVQEAARTAAASGVALSVMTANWRARALYARSGFADVGEAGPFHRAMAWRASD